MAYSRDLLPIEKLKIARVIAEEAGDIVAPADILAELNIDRARFNIRQPPRTVWTEIVDAVSLGISRDAGYGCDGIVQLLGVITSENHLPGNLRLRDLSFDLGRGRAPPTATSRPGGGHRALFLSYCRDDRPDVDRLHDALKASRPEFEVYQDHRMPPGTRWFDAIFDAATRAPAMVCWTTAAYVKSPFCAFEIGLAAAAGVKRLPVLAPPMPADHALPVYISELQHIRSDDPVDIARIATAILKCLS